MTDVTASIWRIPDVVETVGLSKATVWRRVKDGSFPAPVRLGGARARSVGWRVRDVQDWLAKLEDVVDPS